MIALGLLLLFADVPAGITEDTVYCVRHERKPTIFTPQRECLTLRRWAKVLRARASDDIGPFKQDRRPVIYSASSGVDRRVMTPGRQAYDRGIGYSTDPNPAAGIAAPPR